VPEVSPSYGEKLIVAGAMMECGELIGSLEEIWTHPLAYKCLGTLRLCVEGIQRLVASKQAVDADSIKAVVMYHNGFQPAPYMLSDLAEYLTVNSYARLHWSTQVPDSMFPHRCPFCSAAAFIGFLQIECKNDCRRPPP
jgi:hypothetical protein